MPNVGSLAETMKEVVKVARPLQTFKEGIDSKGFRIKELDDELTTTGNDGLSIVERL